MPYIYEFIINSASYFIMAYFVYSIIGRKRTISIIGLSILLLTEVYYLVESIIYGMEVKYLILNSIAYILPIIIAFYAFMRLTGGFPATRFKFIGKKVKAISNDIQTKYTSTLWAYISIVGSLIFGILAYFYIEEFTKYIIIPSLFLAFAFGIYVVITNSKISSEKIILIIGKNKERIYQYIIPKNKKKVVTTDFYNNPDYIVDPVGLVILIQDDKKIEKHYIYWIATGDKIDVDKALVAQITNLSYKESLDIFEKYHYRSLTFQMSRMGKAELIKNKMIR